MGFDEGCIVLDSANHTYYAGQTIFGKLEFQQDKVKTFRGIYVKIKGFAHVHWTTSHERRVNDKTEHYTVNHNAHEDYFSVKQYLVGDASGEHQLSPGNHIFNFQSQIPAHCPSSYEHTLGHIRYELQIVVDRAFKLDQEKKISFRVIAPLDLNQDPYCKEPMNYHFEDTFCCFCMKSGYYETIVKLPVAGYCSGQIIPIEISCCNKSNVEINKIKLALIQKITFHAHDAPGTKNEENVIAEIKKGPIYGNITRNWTVEMEVPSMDIYNVNSCHIIDIDYYFKVKVCPIGCHKSSSDTRRIVLGTVPLVGYQDDVRNPLQDQMPQQQATVPNLMPQFYPQNSHPSPNLSHERYPGANPPNPTDSYSSNGPPYHGANPPYPGANPYPGAAPPYSGANPPYTNAAPYPGIIPLPPYSNTSSPYQNNPPYSGTKPPYPTVNPIHPAPSPIIGFKIPEEKQNSPFHPMPFPETKGDISVTPSAPEATTPDDDTIPESKNVDTSNYNYPYNPEFMKSQNK